MLELKKGEDGEGRIVRGMIVAMDRLPAERLEREQSEAAQVLAKVINVQKEEEFSDIVHPRVQQLNAAIPEADEHIQAIPGRFKQLLIDKEIPAKQADRLVELVAEIPEVVLEALWRSRAPKPPT